MQFDFSKSKTLSLAALLALSLTGCGGETDSDNNNDDGARGNITGDAQNNWSASVVTDNMDASDSSKAIAVYDLSTGTSQSVASMDDYSGNWHFSYKKHRFFHTNSGTSGAGNNGTEIEGCIAHEYTELYDTAGEAVPAELEKLNATNTLAKFEEIDTDACTTFSTDSAKTSKQFGDEWYQYADRTFSIADGTKGWIVKSADDTYARITPKSYDSGFIFSVELWDGSNWGTALDTPALDYYMGSNAYYDFDTNTGSGSADTQGWDIYLKKTNHMPEIILADGATVAYYYDSDKEDDFTYESVAQIDNPTTPTVGASLYKWYENDTNGAMRGPGDLGAIEMHSGYTFSPTYTTYLLKEGNTYYKVQILGYKGTDGEQSSGNIVVRYASKTVE